MLLLLKSFKCKKWIAHSNDFAKGEIHVNAGAKEALLGNKATSVLFVGVTHIKGDFEKERYCKIIDEKGIQVGVGKTQYESVKPINRKKGQRH